MSPLYPCGKPCSTGTRNETVKKLTLFSAIGNGIMVESLLRISNLVDMLSVLQLNKKFLQICRNYIVTHKSLNLIAPLGRSEFGPK